MNVFVEYMIGLGLEVGKDKFKENIEQKKIRKSLQLFIESEKEINEVSTIVEEIDFQGLADYINNNLLNEVKLYIFGKYKERARVRQTIFNKALLNSKVNTEQSKKKVEKIISTILDILKFYYRENIGHELLQLSGEIVDDVKSIIQEETQRVIDKTEINNILSVDKNLQLTKAGNLSEVETNINDFINCIGSVHALYPDYKYIPMIKDGRTRFISKPLSSDALKKYPPKIEFKGKIKLGTQYLNEFNLDVINYANRHQLPITLNIEEAKKYLGDIIDPTQYEAEELIGKKLILPPTPFPDASAYSILINENVEFEYILLRTQEILEDGTIIVTNAEQENFPFRICIKIHIRDRKTHFDIDLENPSNRDIIKYMNFMKKVSTGARMEIRILSEGKNLLEGTLNQYEYNGDFVTIDEEISFFEKVIHIEKFFKKTINLPKEINPDDYEIICYIANVISGEGYYNNWSTASLSIVLSDINKNKILLMKELQYTISYIGEVEISLYNEKYQFTIRRTFEKVKVKNIERLKEKVKVLDIGDTIKIEYLPGEENGKGAYFDILNTDS